MLIFQDSYPVNDDVDRQMIVQELNGENRKGLLDIKDLLEQVMGKNSDQISESIFIEKKMGSLDINNDRNIEHLSGYGRWVISSMFQFQDQQNRQINGGLTNIEEQIRIDSKINATGFIRPLTRVRENNMQTYSIHDSYSSVYEDKNIMVVTNNYTNIDGTDKTSQQKLDDLMDKENEERYNYYVDNPKQLLVDMIGDSGSNSSNNNVGIAMTFNSSTSTINAKLIGNSFEYMILRPIDGQYKCIDHDLDQRTNQYKQINKQLQERDIVIAACNRLLSEIGVSKIEYDVNNNSYKYNGDTLQDRIATSLKSLVYGQFLKERNKYMDKSIIALASIEYS